MNQVEKSVGAVGGVERIHFNARRSGEGCFFDADRLNFGNVNGRSREHIVHKVWTTICCGCTSRQLEKIVGPAW
jgi:hypothetical protein